MAHIAANNLFFIRRMGAVKDKMVDKCYYEKELVCLGLAAGVFSVVQADETRLLRFPATNGTDVVFTYAGDLYKAPLSGGEAQRLTSHIGYEIFPRFSPDGKSIALRGSMTEIRKFI